MLVEIIEDDHLILDGFKICKIKKENIQSSSIGNGLEIIYHLNKWVKDNGCGPMMAFEEYQAAVSYLNHLKDDVHNSAFQFALFQCKIIPHKERFFKIPHPFQFITNPDFFKINSYSKQTPDIRKNFLTPPKNTIFADYIKLTRKVKR